MKSIIILFVFSLLICFSTKSLKAQTAILDSSSTTVLATDTLLIKPEKFHSPTKASLFSTVIPGLGQAYNKKYWKIPVVYAAIGIPLYFAITNQKEFNRYKTAYGNRLDGDDTTIDEFEGVFSTAALESNLNNYQRNKDLSYILVGLFYVFNIVDAAVDAHLFNFPKNDNLSFNLQPNLELTSNNQLNRGFKLVISL